MSNYQPHFPVGYHKVHSTKIIDYQLNRWHSMGYLSLESIQAAGAEIEGLADWPEVTQRYAEKALTRGNLVEAAFYYRAAEFFVAPEAPEKQQLHQRFSELFYKDAFAAEPFARGQIDYPGGKLYALDLPAQGPCKGTLVIHGGFDSFVEELYSLGKFFSLRGYRVVMYDGPGQGRVLKEHQIPITHRWELSAKAVLDHFKLSEVAWLGVSMGGWLCFRAAALEPRIKQVIALSIAYDYLAILPDWAVPMVHWLYRQPRLFSSMAQMKMKLLAQERWGILNLMYILQEETPLAAGRAFLAFNAENLLSEQVTQDVLILSGKEDHFIPEKLHHLQVAALSKARSVTAHLFEASTQAHNHCMVGNLGLCTQTISDWLDPLVLGR